MTIQESIESNQTGLRFAPYPLTGTDVWAELEPNSYSDFGSQIKLTPRNPINRNRQRRKGPPTDQDVSGGHQEDLTYYGSQSWYPGLFCAAPAVKPSVAVPSVDGTTDHQYEPASGGAAFHAGDILVGVGFTQAANNGRKIVTGSPGASAIPSSGGGLVDESTSSGRVHIVGYQFASGDAVIVASGDRFALQTTTKDLTTLGLTVGEWFFMGGDSAGTQWVAESNCGWARIYSIAAHDIVIDRFVSVVEGEDIATDAGTSKTLEIYTGTVLKNLTGDAITRPLYVMERTLGAPDDANPADVQAEYINKFRFSKNVITFNTADKITQEVTYTGCDYESVDAGDMKPGTRPTLVPGPAFNTATNMMFCRLDQYDDAMGTPLLETFLDASHTVDNNISPNKALTKFGAKSLTAGTFSVTATLTGYFIETAFNAAVRNAASCSQSIGLVSEDVGSGKNVGIVFDMPLVSLSDGRLKVTQDAPITVPLNVDAATAIDVNPNADYTYLANFFDYLPALATPTG